MKNPCSLLSFVICIATLLGNSQSPAQAQSEGLDYLTRGPVHEAFATVVPYDLEPNPILDTPPPGPIDEVPPDYKPEGENVLWIPGYWAWDEASDDYIWISGIWRQAPPDTYWTPGYWARVESGYQWVPGYWETAEISEVEYLPAPPESLEQGPNSPSPHPDWIWNPGVWIWEGNRYVWRAGYWMEPEGDWVWVPAHYVWSPIGYVFVDGFWDYQVSTRGALYAPVRFHETWFSAPGHSFTPSVVIDLGLLTDYLFARVGHTHYYFGDYYDPHFSEVGYIPWFDYHLDHYGYDPVFAFEYYSDHDHDDHWVKELREDYRAKQKYEDRRPPWSFAQHKKGPDHHEFNLGHRFEDVVTSPGSVAGIGNFRKVEDKEIKNWGQQKKLLQQIESDRASWETQARKGERPPGKGKGMMKRGLAPDERPGIGRTHRSEDRIGALPGKGKPRKVDSRRGPDWKAGGTPGVERFHGKKDTGDHGRPTIQSKPRPGHREVEQLGHGKPSRGGPPPHNSVDHPRGGAKKSEGVSETPPNRPKHSGGPPGKGFGGGHGKGHAQGKGHKGGHGGGKGKGK